MQTLNHPAYVAFREGAEVIEADGSGDKVLVLADGTMLKFFRRKRLMSSALLFPYAQRFAANTKALRQRDVPCPQVLDVYRIPSIERDAVHYRPLSGETIRRLYATDAPADLRFRLGRFVAELHAKGVYFRSLHLGNIVLGIDQRLGLIDVADMSCRRNALSPAKRLRNFQHMARYRKDMQWLEGTDSAQPFLQGYEQGLDNRPDSMRMLQQLAALFT